MTPERKFALIVLGATSFPKTAFGDSPSFGASAAAIREYFCATFVIADDNVLNLFDSEINVSDQSNEIFEFLDRRPDITDLFLFYVGHGDLTRANDLFLYCRSTNSRNKMGTGLIYHSLITQIHETNPRSRIVIILDCCFAGTAAAVLQGPAATIIGRETSEVIPKRGYALLTATSAGHPAIAPLGAKYTLFTEHMLRVLRNGIPAGHECMTLFEVKEATRQSIMEEANDKRALPELHSVGQSEGDLASVRLFPNPAFKRTTGAGLATNHEIVYRIECSGDQPSVEPSGAEINLRGKLTIGRDKENDIVIRGDRAVSWTHATLLVNTRGLHVVDGSANGIRVNGTKIRRRAHLKDGDKFQLGNVEFSVTLVAGRPATVGEEFADEEMHPQTHVNQASELSSDRAAQSGFTANTQVRQVALGPHAAATAPLADSGSAVEANSLSSSEVSSTTQLEGPSTDKTVNDQETAVATTDRAGDDQETAVATTGRAGDDQETAVTTTDRAGDDQETAVTTTDRAGDDQETAVATADKNLPGSGEDSSIEDEFEHQTTTARGRRDRALREALDVRAVLSCARQLIDDSMPSEAARILLDFLSTSESHSESSDVYLQLGHTYKLVGDLPAAASAYRMFALSSKDPMAWYQVAKLFQHVPSPAYKEFLNEFVNRVARLPDVEQRAYESEHRQAVFALTPLLNIHIKETLPFKDLYDWVSNNGFDLRVGAMFLRVTRRLQPGTKVEVDLRYSDESQAVQLRGVVAGLALRSPKEGMAISFTFSGVDTENKRRLAAFFELKKRLSDAGKLAGVPDPWR